MFLKYVTHQTFLENVFMLLYFQQFFSFFRFGGTIFKLMKTDTFLIIFQLEFQELASKNYSYASEVFQKLKPTQKIHCLYSYAM